MARRAVDVIRIRFQGEVTVESNHFEREVLHKLDALQQSLAIALVNLSKVQTVASDAINHLTSVEAKLDKVLASLDLISKKEDTLMALADDLKTAIAALDTETNAVAANIAQLASRITNSMSDADVAAIKAALSAESTRLTTLALDPTNPVPPVPAALKAARAAK